MPHLSPTTFIEITIIFQPEGDKWTAECRELGTAAFGDTIDETREAILDLIRLHIETLEELGECDRFLRESGVKVHRIPPKHVSTVALRDIPFGALIQSEVRELVSQ